MQLFEIQRPMSLEQIHDSGWGWQRFLLLMILLQSIGIRALPMQGVLVSVLICLVLAPRIEIPLRQFISLILFSVILLILSSRGMSSYTGIAYFTLVLFTAFFFIKYVERRWAEVEFDLLIITWWLSLHGLISYLVYKVLPSFFTTVALGGMKYKVFAVLVLISSDPVRASGLCWEPGLLQYVANLSLFLGIRHSWPPWKLAVSFLAVVATFSTAGIFCLIPSIFYLFILHGRSLWQWLCIAICAVLVSASIVSVFRVNISEKLGGTNTSGLIRLRDLQVGWELIKDKPLLGHGQFDEKYLLSNSNIWAVSTELFSKGFLAAAGDFGGGYTNGFLGFLASYGIFIGAFFYWCFFNNRLIQGGFKERVTFFSISILTFISEPITNTSWFFFLAISGLYSRQLHANILAIHRKIMPQKI